LPSAKEIRNLRGEEQVEHPTAGDLRRAEECAAQFADWGDVLCQVAWLVDKEIERMKSLGIYKEPQPRRA
jgi:hypothetical protein